MSSAIIGVITAFALMTVSVMYTTDNALVYLNLLGFMIVVGGTLSAAAISFRISDLLKLFLTVFRVFRKDFEHPEAVVSQLIHVSNKVSRRGRYIAADFANDKIHPFIKDGLRLVENDFNEKQIEEIMTSSALERKNTFIQDIEVLNTLAKYPPAFGMIGTVLGLVALLGGLADEKSSKLIGPNMSVALLTTLYGLLFANYVFIPMTDNLMNKLKHEMQLRRIIIKGILMICKHEDPILVQEMLNAYLIPSKRLDLDAMNQGSEERLRRVA